MNNLTGRQIYGTRKPIVSVAARESARGENCTVNLRYCNYNSATTVLAHLRFFGWAGMAQKPADYKAVYACSSCHDAIDRRNNDAESEWEFEDILRAWGRTLDRMFETGVLGFSK
jgi:hypothetical protein